MRQVKLILSEDVANLGAAGDLVSVKPGYARNFLIPQGKASFATEGNVRALEHQRRIVAEKVARELKVLEEEKRRIEGAVVEIRAQVGEEGKLFGSVTSAQIAEALASLGHDVDRRKIGLAEPLKEVGEFDVPLRLHSQVEAMIKVRVVSAD